MKYIEYTCMRCIFVPAIKRNTKIKVMNYTERTKTLFIDIKSLKASVVIINGVNSNSPIRKEEMFSISKSVNVYGLEEYINQMIETYVPTKVTYCDI